MINAKMIIGLALIYTSLLPQTAFSDTISFETRIGHFTIVDQISCGGGSYNEKIVYSPFAHLGKGGISYTGSDGQKKEFVVKSTFTGPDYPHRINKDLTVIYRLFTQTKEVNEFGHPNAGPMIDIVRTTNGRTKLIDSKETQYQYLAPTLIQSETGIGNCEGLVKD
jgi:hypothetical protein